MIKKTVISLAILFLIILVISAARAFLIDSRQIHPVKRQDVKFDETRALRNLSRALTFRTIAHDDPTRTDPSEFLRFHRFLEKSYPVLHARLKRETVNRLSLLYTWQGSDPALKPILLMAHMDVVPAEGSTLSRWTHPPFSGRNDGTHIWGRGALDMKSSLIGIMEAVELLVSRGFRPRRTVYIALGCDEEQGGDQGSMLIARLLASRGIRLDLVLDEGGTIARGMTGFLSAPVAFVGIAEKGYLTLELAVESQGGHSSMPPRETPAGVLCTAVSRLENSPFPYRIDGVVGTMLGYLAAESPPLMRFVLANRWIFGPLIRAQMSASPPSAAALHTTIAPTVLQGSERDNVIPSRARALVNFRILPGDTVESVTSYVRRVINDPRVKVSASGTAWNPSPVSSSASREFRVLHETIAQVFPGTVITPYLVLGATDSRYYNSVSGNVFRFMPCVLTKDDIGTMHGINEKISAENMKRGVAFYFRFIENLN